MSWYIKVLKNYAVFSGRARRKEYWMFSVFNFIFFLVLAIIDVIIGIETKTELGVLITIDILTTIYILVTSVPTIAVGVRRLHDTNRSGWWYFISLVPLVGGIILIVYFVKDSQPGENQYGLNPKSGLAKVTYQNVTHRVVLLAFETYKAKVALKVLDIEQLGLAAFIRSLRAEKAGLAV